MVNASEPYVTSIDDDDLFPSRDMFSYRLQTMEENPKMSFITGYLANLEPTTHGVGDPNIPLPRYELLTRSMARHRHLEEPSW